MRGWRDGCVRRRMAVSGQRRLCQKDTEFQSVSRASKVLSLKVIWGTRNTLDCWHVPSFLTLESLDLVIICRPLHSSGSISHHANQITSVVGSEPISPCGYSQQSPAHTKRDPMRSLVKCKKRKILLPFLSNRILSTLLASQVDKNRKKRELQ